MEDSTHRNSMSVREIEDTLRDYNRDIEVRIIRRGETRYSKILHIGTSPYDNGAWNEDSTDNPSKASWVEILID